MRRGALTGSPLSSFLWRTEPMAKKKKATAKKTLGKQLPKPDDKNAAAPVFRLDHGESLPAPEK